MTFIKKNFTTILLVIIFLVGLSLLLYPSFSDYWNKIHQSRLISRYAENVANIDDEHYKKMLEEAVEFNKKLENRSFDLALSKEDEEEYYRILDISDTGIMAYIDIPSIKCSLPIYHGTNDSILQIAVGHLEGTSLPVGGINTHCVLSGHRGLPSAKLFTDLNEVKEGDQFMIRTLDETLTYEVDQIRIVFPNELDALQIVNGQDLCTLVTCTPYGVNSHRLLVRGHRVDTDNKINIRVTADAIQIEPIIVAPVVAVPILLILLIWLLLTTRSKKYYEVSELSDLKNLFLLLLIVGIIGASQMNVEAKEMPDLSKNGECSISVTVKDTDTKEPVSGGELSLYKIAHVSEENGFCFEYEAGLKKCAYSLEEVDNPELASELSAYVDAKNIAEIEKKTIEDNGRVTFENLDLGLYLVRQTKSAENYSSLSSFLITVPLTIDGEMSYHVDAAPKAGTVTKDSPDKPDKPEKPEKPDKPEKPNKPSDKLPQTGQLWWPVPVLLIAGLICLIIGRKKARPW